MGEHDIEIHRAVCNSMANGEPASRPSTEDDSAEVLEGPAMAGLVTLLPLILTLVLPIEYPMRRPPEDLRLDSKRGVLDRHRSAKGLCCPVRFFGTLRTFLTQISQNSSSRPRLWEEKRNGQTGDRTTGLPNT